MRVCCPTLVTLILMVTSSLAQERVESDFFVADRGNAMNGSDGAVRHYSYTGNLIATLPAAGSGQVRGLGVAEDGSWELIWKTRGKLKTPEAVLLERHGISDALARARRFAFGHYDVLFRVLLAQGVAFVGGAVLADQLGGALLDFGLQLGRPFGALFEGGSLSALLGLFAAVPFVASARFLQYIDGRTRRDGWDIQLAFLALGPDETEGTP